MWVLTRQILFHGSEVIEKPDMVSLPSPSGFSHSIAVASRLRYTELSLIAIAFVRSESICPIKALPVSYTIESRRFPRFVGVKIMPDITSEATVFGDVVGISGEGIVLIFVHLVNENRGGKCF